jgi:signal transduction histidine kinase
MDSKRIFDNAHIRNLYDLFKHKFTTFDFQVAIAIDDPAFRFMLNYHSRLLPETPVIFCGVNYFEEYALYGQEYFTGVLEVVDIEDTLDMALNLNPDAQHVLVIVDKTPTSVSVIQSFITILNKYSHRLTIYFNEDMTMEELLTMVEALPKNSIAIIANFTIDKSGNVFSLEDSTRLITQRANVPVFSFWDSYLGLGILGGKLISGQAQGKKSAEIALRIFNGEKPRSIPVVKRSPNAYMFDYRVLERFSIDKKLLPDEHIIVNTPLTFYTQHKRLIWIIAGGFAGLSLIIIVLSFNILRRIRAESNLKKYSYRLEILNRIGRAILEAKPTEDIAYDVLGYVRSLFACKRVSVLLFDYTKNEAFVLAVDTDSETKISKGSIFSLNDFHVEELRAGEIVTVEDINTLDKKTNVDVALLSESITTIVRIPLFYDAGLIGSLNLGHDDYNVFDDDNIRIVRQISAPLAIAIQNAKFVNKIITRENDLKRMSERLIKSQEEERKKISLELHDELGQALTAIHMNLSIIEKTIPEVDNPESAKETLQETIEYVKTMAGQIRTLSHELRPPMLDVLGLIPSLKSHIKGIQKRTGMHIVLASENCDQRFIPEAEITLFRIIQESLHNIVKHAGSKNVSVMVRQEGDFLKFCIEDDGVGIGEDVLIQATAAEFGMGIMGMQERTSSLGGTLTVDSGENGGVKVSIDIPMQYVAVGANDEKNKSIGR